MLFLAADDRRYAKLLTRYIWCRCVPVRLFVCHRPTLVLSQNSKTSRKQRHTYDSPCRLLQFSVGTDLGVIRTGSPPTGAPNGGRVGWKYQLTPMDPRDGDSRQISHHWSTGNDRRRHMAPKAYAVVDCIYFNGMFRSCKIFSARCNLSLIHISEPTRPY